MTQAHEAADEIRRLAKMFENMQHAAAVLEKIGSLEQAAAEAASAYEAAKVGLDNAIAGQAEAEARLADIHGQADAVMLSATAKASDVRLLAEESAGKIISDAKAGAEKLIREAVVRVQASEADWDLRKDAINAKVRELQGMAADEKLRLAAMAEEAIAVERRLAAAKAEVAKMLGGP